MAATVTHWSARKYQRFLYPLYLPACTHRPYYSLHNHHFNNNCCAHIACGLRIAPSLSCISLLLGLATRYKGLRESSRRQSATEHCCVCDLVLWWRSIGATKKIPSNPSCYLFDAKIMREYMWQKEKLCFGGWDRDLSGSRYALSLWQFMATSTWFVHEKEVTLSE